jgi:glycosyltransferase involved in cell wall biosynthesis
VFALPSFGEPFGLVYLEAMAMKRPAVALSYGGAAEVVEDGKCGLISPPGDINALSANLLGLLRDPALRQRFGEHGRKRAAAHFTPARMAADVADLYARLLA